jgi:hypothetical protein
MGLEIELRLISIRCIKPTEEEDEFYVKFSAKSASGSVNTDIRYPTESPKYWSIKAGQITGPNICLFSGMADSTTTFRLGFMEEDAGGFISMADDNLGGISVVIEPLTAKAEWTPEKNTEVKKVEDTFVVRLTGAKGEYEVTLKLMKKVPF